MTTCVYETTAKKPGEKPRYIGIKQAMSDKPLTTHPETGESIRRVVLGGYGVLTSSPATRTKESEGDCGCGPGGCGS